MYDTMLFMNEELLEELELLSPNWSRPMSWHGFNNIQFDLIKHHDFYYIVALPTPNILQEILLRIPGGILGALLWKAPIMKSIEKKKLSFRLKNYSVQNLELIANKDACLFHKLSIKDFENNAAYGADLIKTPYLYINHKMIQGKFFNNPKEVQKLKSYLPLDKHKTSIEPKDSTIRNFILLIIILCVVFFIGSIVSSIG